jgi:hypothetical protein
VSSNSGASGVATGTAANTSATVSPPANLQAGPGLGISTGSGPAAANGATASGSTDGSNGDGGYSSGGYYGTGTAQERARAYSLRAIYFRRDFYENAADCLTAAYAQQLPLELCK